MMVLADGTVVQCDQDFQGKTAIGSIERDSLVDLWRNGQLKSLRQMHLAGRYDTNDLCAACRQWHRP